MAHHKNRRPKPYKGCCWMCAKGIPRNHREPTLQEQRARGATLSEIDTYLRPGVSIEDEAIRPATYYDEVVEDGFFWMEDEVDRAMGLFPATSVPVGAFNVKIGTPVLPVSLVRSMVLGW